MRSPTFGSAALAGALLAGLGTVAAGYALRGLGARSAATALQQFLGRGGWLWIPLWGAAASVLLTLTRVRSLRDRFLALTLGVALALVPVLLRPVVPLTEPPPSASHPSSPSEKAMAIRRWAYRSPAAVANLLAYASDPDPIVREMAVQALGINLIVSDVEHAGPERAARFGGSPLRDSLRSRLAVALVDSVEAIRAEAARALWKAPRTFGQQPAAAETLTAVVTRRAISGVADRPVRLAIDALAARPDSALAEALARYARVTTEPGTRRAALAALEAAAHRR
ncbi:MAG: hypothetical protein HYR73_00320 [Candidatus Eisenbacteria bacterium]|nr:hypothetical protein [Candidatus Eisenbacteria bacterium]